MSDLTARTAIERMHMQPVMVDRNHAMQVANNLSRMARIAPDQEADEETKVMRQLSEAYGFGNRDKNKPFMFQNGVAVIPIHGTLINRFGSCWGYVTGYNHIQRMRNLANADPDVELIVYDVHSGGGEVAGAFETAQAAFASRGQKPSIAVVDHASYSAAYLQSVAADKIYVTPTGGVGSVGVYLMHINMAKMLENWGLEIELIHSGDNKVDGNPFEKLPESVRANYQAGVDKSRQKFVDVVAQYRGIDGKMVYDTEGRTYDADEALSMGLIDGIATPAEAVGNYLAALRGEAPDEEVETGGYDDEDKASAELISAGATAERQRVKAILTSPQAKGKPTVANYLAFQTVLGADAAIEVLKKT